MLRRLNCLVTGASGFIGANLVHELLARKHQVRALLRPGGRLHLSTIDTGSLVARLLGGRWPWLMDMHLVYFDRPTLTSLLEECGFRVTEVGLYSHTVSAGYLLRKVGASFPALRPAAALLARLVPGRWPVPVNLGDNMLVSAERA